MVGTVYLIHTGEFVGFKMNIYKIGKTCDLQRRLKEYPFFTETKYTSLVNDHDNMEKILILKFRKHFINRRDYGLEYFQGDINQMINIMKKIIDKVNHCPHTLATSIHNNIIKLENNKHNYAAITKPKPKQKHRLNYNKQLPLNFSLNCYFNIQNPENYQNYELINNYKKIKHHYNISKYFFGEDFNHSIKLNVNYSQEHIDNQTKKLKFLDEFIDKCNIVSEYDDELIERYTMANYAHKIFKITELPTKEISDAISKQYIDIYGSRKQNIDFTNEITIFRYLSDMYRALFGEDLYGSRRKGKQKNQIRFINKQTYEQHKQLYNHRRICQNEINTINNLIECAIDNL